MSNISCNKEEFLWENVGFPALYKGDEIRLCIFSSPDICLLVQMAYMLEGT